MGLLWLLLANWTHRLVAEPLVQAVLVEAVLAGHFPQQCTLLYVFKADGASAPCISVTTALAKDDSRDRLYLLRACTCSRKLVKYMSLNLRWKLLPRIT